MTGDGPKARVMSDAKEVVLSEAELEAMRREIREQETLIRGYQVGLSLLHHEVSAVLWGTVYEHLCLPKGVLEFKLLVVQWTSVNMSWIW